MKKELSPGATNALIAGAVLLVIAVGYFFYKKSDPAHNQAPFTAEQMAKMRAAAGTASQKNAAAISQGGGQR